MKKLLLLLTISIFSLGAFAESADLCNDERDKDKKADLIDYDCTQSDVDNGVNGCTKAGQTVKVQQEG